MSLPKVPQSRAEINLAWMQEALKQAPFQILDMAWANGSVGDGIGVMSSLERVTLTILPDDGGEAKKISVIVKTPPSGNPDLRKFVLSEGN